MGLHCPLALPLAPPPPTHTHLQRLLAHLELSQHILQPLLTAIQVAGLDHVGDVGCIAHQVLGRGEVWTVRVGS